MSEYKQGGRVESEKSEKPGAQTIVNGNILSSVHTQYFDPICGPEYTELVLSAASFQVIDSFNHSTTRQFSAARCGAVTASVFKQISLPKRFAVRVNH